MLRTSPIALAALVLGLALTGWLWRMTSNAAHNEARSAFEQKAEFAKLAVDRVTEEIAAALRGLRAFQEVVPDAGPGEFARHVEALNLRLFASGLQYLGLIKPIAPGEPHCAERDSGARRPCFVMQRVYPPATNQATLDVDVGRITERAEALARAVDSGYLAATPPVAPTFDNAADPGVVVYLAVYRPAMSLSTLDQRREALLGVVTAAFSLEDLVRAEAGGRFFQDVGMTISDAGLVGHSAPNEPADRLVFDGKRLVRWINTQAQTLARSNDLARTLQREFAGRNWRIELAAHAPAGRIPSHFTPIVVLALGVLASALLFGYLQIVARARARAERLAADMTVDLREREERLRQALQAASMGAWEWEVSTRSITQDARAAELMAAGGGGLDALIERIHPADRERVRDSVEAALASRGDLDVECRLVDPGGEERWVELSARIKAGPNGAPERAVGLVRDISERKRQAEARRVLALRLATAQEEERRNIARELHDQMGQDITALALGLRNLEARGAWSPAERDLLDRLLRMVAGVDHQVDNVMAALRPVALDDHGLEAALREHVTDWSRLHGIHADLHVFGISERLPFSVETTLYRVVQEALTNIAKHARARRVGVVIERRQGHVQAIIEDDGQGFDVEAASQADARTYGLIGMRERVELLDGTLKIESTKAVGTTLYARLPLLEQEHQT